MKVQCRRCGQASSLFSIDISTFICQACRDTESNQEFESTRAKAIKAYPEENAECYILIDGKQHGPHSPSQLVSMYKSAQITTDTLYWYSKLENWTPIKEIAAIGRSNALNVSTISPLFLIGGFCFIAGAITTFYFFTQFDTAIYSDGRFIENIGLLNKRQNGIIIGVGLAIIGVICVATQSVKNRNS